jgi:hypothetical protein
VGPAECVSPCVVDSAGMNSTTAAI